MLDFLTREQILWIHDHAMLLAVLTVVLVVGGICLLVVWIDGGIDDDGSFYDGRYLGTGSGH